MKKECHKVATIGTFDGVHCGHRIVLEQVLSIASSTGLAPFVYAFAEHPLEIIDPSRVPPKLMTFEAQCRKFEQLGLNIHPIRFNEELRNMTSSDYMQELHDRHLVDTLVIGYDNKFGHDRDSSFEDYQRFAGKIGLNLIKAEELPDVSSTIIRRLITEGKIEEANKKLGYLYPLHGIVKHGKELGQTIGFPTANLHPDDHKKLIPANGVYAAFAITPDGQRHGAMVNIGHRPTIRDGRTYRSIEANIFDFNDNLYGKSITLEFVCLMRQERPFKSIDELKTQLVADKENAIKILSNENN